MAGLAALSRLSLLRYAVACLCHPVMLSPATIFVITLAACSNASAVDVGASQSSSLQRPLPADEDGGYTAVHVQSKQGYDYIVKSNHATQIVPGHMTPWIQSFIPTSVMLKASSKVRQLLSSSLASRQAGRSDILHHRRRQRNRRRRLLSRLQAATGLSANADPMSDSSEAADTEATEAVADGTQHTEGLAGHTISSLPLLIAVDTKKAAVQRQTGHLMFEITLPDQDDNPANLSDMKQLWLQQNVGTMRSDTADFSKYADAAVDTSGAESLGYAEAVLMGGKHKKPWSPVTDWPAVPPGGIYPQPPCSNGLVQQDNRCVCPPGSGRNPTYNGCVKCADGWASVGGPLPVAQCKPCPQLTTSNAARTACVMTVQQPDVNQALCETCFDPSKPFQPPACCPKGQTCCGAYGCCGNCINNATTNQQPFCCEAASNPCPLATGTTYGLECCINGTTCLNTSSSGTQVCCPIGGVCLGSTVDNNKCCNPPQAFTCAVDTSGVAQCCSGPFCIGEGTNGACCNAGQYCTNGRKCCNSPNAQICRDPIDPNLGEICCGVDTTRTCLSSPLNPGLQLCCPTAVSSFVCNNQCCDESSQQCVNDSVCCNTDAVCPSPSNPNVEICCASGTTCDSVTKTCR